MRHLDKGYFVIFAAGTGNPYESVDAGRALVFGQTPFGRKRDSGCGGGERAKGRLPCSPLRIGALVTGARLLNLKECGLESHEYLRPLAVASRGL